jgi:cobalt-zinc-cadmium efflux system outer membrane protein
MNKNFLKSSASALLLSFLMVFRVQGQSQELSLDEVLSVFYQRNLDLIAAQYNID